jgi:hypothetical protein
MRARRRWPALVEEGRPVAWGRKDERAALDRALEAAAGLRVGTWTSVETFAMLAIEARGRPQAETLYEMAKEASVSLAAGSWESVRALTWLARAKRELDRER